MAARSRKNPLYSKIFFVGLPAGSSDPSIFLQYPQQTSDEIEKLNKNVASFCFPDPPEPLRSLELDTPQFYCVVLTSGDASRLYASILRIAVFSQHLPAACSCHASTLNPQAVAICLISRKRWSVLHASLLRGLLSVYAHQGCQRAHEFLAQVHAHEMPARGEALTLRLPSFKEHEIPAFLNTTPSSSTTTGQGIVSAFPGEDGTGLRGSHGDRAVGKSELQPLTVRFERAAPSETALLNVNFEPLLQKLSGKSLLRVISSLLFERRVIFVADALPTVTWCVQAAVALLYPFEWQHVYVPVLPKSMLSSCCAPMPYVIGVLRSMLDDVIGMDGVPAAVIVDLDNDQFMMREGIDSMENDADLIPSHIRRELTNAFRQLRKRKMFSRTKKPSVSTEDGTSLPPQVRANKLLDSVLSFFVDILADYRDFLRPDTEDGFAKAEFVASVPEELRRFLQLLMKTQMFEVFVQKRLRRAPLGNEGNFDQRVSVYQTIKQEYGHIAPNSRFSLFESNASSQDSKSKELKEKKFAMLGRMGGTLGGVFKTFLKSEEYSNWIAQRGGNSSNSNSSNSSSSRKSTTPSHRGLSPTPSAASEGRKSVAADRASRRRRQVRRSNSWTEQEFRDQVSAACARGDPHIPPSHGTRGRTSGRVLGAKPARFLSPPPRVPRRDGINNSNTYSKNQTLPLHKRPLPKPNASLRNRYRTVFPPTTGSQTQRLPARAYFMSAPNATAPGQNNQTTQPRSRMGGNGGSDISSQRSSGQARADARAQARSLREKFEARNQSNASNQGPSPVSRNRMVSPPPPRRKGNSRDHPPPVHRALSPTRAKSPVQNVSRGRDHDSSFRRLPQLPKKTHRNPSLQSGHRSKSVNPIHAPRGHTPERGVTSPGTLRRKLPGHPAAGLGGRVGRTPQVVTAQPRERVLASSARRALSPNPPPRRNVGLGRSTEGSLTSHSSSIKPPKVAARGGRITARPLPPPPTMRKLDRKSRSSHHGTLPRQVERSRPRLPWAMSSAEDDSNRENKKVMIHSPPKPLNSSFHKDSFVGKKSNDNHSAANTSSLGRALGGNPTPVATKVSGEANYRSGLSGSQGSTPNFGGVRMTTERLAIPGGKKPNLHGSGKGAKFGGSVGTGLSYMIQNRPAAGNLSSTPGSVSGEGKSMSTSAHQNNSSFPWARQSRGSSGPKSLSTAKLVLPVAGKMTLPSEPVKSNQEIAAEVNVKPSDLRFGRTSSVRHMGISKLSKGLQSRSLGELQDPTSSRKSVGKSVSERRAMYIQNASLQDKK